MRGRPVLGAISGLLFGAFLAITLQQFSIRPLDNFSVIGLPIIGLLLGLGLAAWAPFGRRPPAKVAAPVAAVTAAGAAARVEDPFAGVADEVVPTAPQPTMAAAADAVQDRVVDAPETVDAAADAATEATPDLGAAPAAEETAGEERLGDAEVGDEEPPDPTSP